MRKMKNWVVNITILISVILMVPIMVNAAEEITVGEEAEGFSNEIWDPITSYGKLSNSFLFEKSDGSGFQSLVVNDGIYVASYDNNWNYIDTITVKPEGTFGGFYAGKENNYIVYGSTEGESDAARYIIAKYDKEFNLLNSLSITGDESYTAIPFYGGNVSMEESGDFLIVYTARGRLDGHQSNIAIRINTDDMSIADDNGMVSSPDIHVSHSFRQIVKFDGEKPVYVDVSDGSPVRSVYLQAIGCKNSVMLEIAGDYGYNVTETDVSGLEISESYYMVVGTQVHNGCPNIYLSCTSKEVDDHTVNRLLQMEKFCGQSILMAKYK